jgi:hypothetical protein
MGYFSVLAYTPIHMIEMAEMGMPMEHCPLAMNQHAICSMAISEHMRQWQNWLQNFSPFSQKVVAGLFLSLAYLFVVSSPILRLRMYARRQNTQGTFSFLQNLFSQGILHPKTH